MIQQQTHIVLGLNFGDEGKGNITNALAASLERPFVVRFNGGHQAGHTVVKGKITHVFSNFGAGTLSGIRTYWSKYCVNDPIGMMNELDALHALDIPIPQMFVDEESPVCTPFDLLANRCDVLNLNDGSCGLGFGKTIERHETGARLIFRDLFYDNVWRKKMEAIRDHYSHISFDAGEVIRRMQAFESAIIKLKVSLVQCVSDFKGLLKFNNIVFEGAQGILLDQHHGFFPNVTRSNTDMTNALKIMGILGRATADLHLVTRSYLTRHGAGFLPAYNTPECFEKYFMVNKKKETNVFNDYQKDFRISFLEHELLEFSVATATNKPDRVDKVNLYVTCYDQTKNDWMVSDKGTLITGETCLEKLAEDNFEFDDIAYITTPSLNLTD